MTHTSLVLKFMATTFAAISFAYTQFPVLLTEGVEEQPASNVAVTTTPIEIVPTVIVRNISNDCIEFSSGFEKYDWPTTTAMQICAAESGGDPQAINLKDKHKDINGNVICESSQGLMQVGCFWPAVLGYTMDDLLDPWQNIDMAYQIYKIAGDSFSPWTTYKR